MVAYIFWDDRQPGRDVSEKLALFLLSDAGDFVPCAKIFLHPPLLLAFFSSTLLEIKTNTHLLTHGYTLWESEIFYIFIFYILRITKISGLLRDEQQFKSFLNHALENVI